MADATDPVSTAQQALADFKGGHDAFVAQFQPAAEALDPGWKAKAEGEYQKQLSGLQREADYQQTQAAKGQQPNSLTTAPAAGSQDDTRNKIAQGTLDVANQRVDLAKEQAAAMDRIRQAQLEGKDVTAALAQAKFDFAQKVAAAKAEQATAAAQAKVDAAQAVANARVENNQNTNARDAKYEQGVLENTAQGQRVTQADTRATNAASILDNGSTTALDIAKGGGTTGQIGDFLKGLLGVAPQFQASMGGAPITVNTPAAAGDLAKIAQLMLSGAVPPDANGNRGPNAITAVAAQNGLLPGSATGSNPNVPAWGPMSAGASSAAPPATTAAIPPGYGTGPGQVMPQFTAPGVA